MLFADAASQAKYSIRKLAVAEPFAQEKHETAFDVACIQQTACDPFAGAWVAAGLVAAAAIAPAASYATSSLVQVHGGTGSGVAGVTQQHQILTATAWSKQVVRLVGGGSGPSDCHAMYTPPSGKALVVTTVTYELGSGTAGTEAWASLPSSDCTTNFDIGDTSQAFDTQFRSYPVGLPVPSLGVYVGTSSVAYVFVTGYLVPSTTVPATQATPGAMQKGKLVRPKRALARRRARGNQRFCQSLGLEFDSWRTGGSILARRGATAPPQHRPPHRPLRLRNHTYDRRSFAVGGERRPVGIVIVRS